MKKVTIMWISIITMIFLAYMPSMTYAEVETLNEEAFLYEEFPLERAGIALHLDRY